MTKEKKDVAWDGGKPFCEAKTRKQYEAATWGAANVGCGNRGVEKVDGHWVCRVHRDENKRYGWN